MSYLDPVLDDRFRWYVLQTKPKQEARAESNLQHWNIETLAPKIRELRQSRRGDSVYHISPLFPNYLFARFDGEALASKVRLTRGVQRVVGFGEYATPVDDAIIDVIQSQMADDGFVRWPDAQPGDTVEIVDGPLRSLLGVFERQVSAHDRVVILLTTIGCRARVEVARTAIRKATRAA
jgi:transcriptional antiterminator RfaH